MYACVCVHARTCGRGERSHGSRCEILDRGSGRESQYECVGDGKREQEIKSGTRGGRQGHRRRQREREREGKRAHCHREGVANGALDHPHEAVGVSLPFAPCHQGQKRPRTACAVPSLVFFLVFRSLSRYLSTSRHPSPSTTLTWRPPLSSSLPLDISTSLSLYYTCVSTSLSLCCTCVSTLFPPHYLSTSLYSSSSLPG